MRKCHYPDSPCAAPLRDRRRLLDVSLCVVLLRVSCVAELSGPDAEVNNDWEGDDVWVELLPVQLVDAHRAGLLEGEREEKNHVTV